MRIATSVGIVLALVDSSLLAQASWQNLNALQPTLAAAFDSRRGLVVAYETSSRSTWAANRVKARAARQFSKRIA